MTRLIAALALLGLLASCGGLRESRLNPSNWFGKSRERRIMLQAGAEIVDPRALVGKVVTLKVDRLPGGAIVRAMGLPTSQGYYSAELVPLNGEKPERGVLKFEFRLLPPKDPNPAGTKRSREVLVGRFVSDQKLAGVRRIEVIGQNNRRIVRR